MLVQNTKRRIYLFVLTLALPCVLALWTYALLYEPRNLLLVWGHPPVAALIAWSIVRLQRRTVTLEALERGGFLSVYVYAIASIVAGVAWPGTISSASELMVLAVAVGAYIALPPRDANIAAGTLFAALVATGWAVLAATGAPGEVWARRVILDVGALCVIGLMSLLAWTRDWWAQVSVTSARLERLALTDTLTGLLNRRGMIERLERIAPRAPLEPLSVIITDLDHFKRINDTHGHAVGDDVLHAFAGVLMAGLRGADLAARWGGEEFLVALPGAADVQAEGVARRLRAMVEAADLLPGEHVTASFGVATFRAGDSLGQLLARADAALYRAKEAGRNRVAIEEAADEPQVPAADVTPAEPHADTRPQA